MAEDSEEIAQMRLDYSTDQRVWDLLAEVERLRDLVGQHDPTGADHLAEMMEHAQRADALYDENKRLREALRDLADAYRGIALNHPTVVTRHLPLIRAEEVLFGSPGGAG